MTEPIVATIAGKVRGRTRDGVHVFRGIPFAAPPVGKLRFRPPAPAVPWDDVRDAIHAGPVAPQLESPLEKMLGAPAPQWDEAECLTLNVWSPGLDDARRPVMVWIHGGAFVNGAGSSPIYDGRKFARNGDVVVVTINYRLGAFGFLHVEPILGDAFAGSGNAGILDQVAALEWVRDNVEGFGGNPDDVTIFGESAGGMSVGTLLGTPAAEGLFHKAIVQSGSSSYTLPSKRAAAIARDVLEAAGITNAADAETVPAEALLAAQGQVLARVLRTEMPFMPVLDGTILPASPLTTIADGATGDVTTMVGTTLDEMTLFLALDLGVGEPDGNAIVEQMRKVFGEHTEVAVGTYTANRAGAPNGDVYTAIATDRVFRIPAIRLAEAQVGQGRLAYMYLFTWATPVFDGKLKSCHALELPFVWDALDKPGLSVLTGDGPERQAIADAMHAAWIRFARTGDPGWPAYDLGRRATQRFDTTLEVLDDPMGDERALWDAIA